MRFYCVKNVKIKIHVEMLIYIQIYANFLKLILAGIRTLLCAFLLC